MHKYIIFLFIIGSSLPFVQAQVDSASVKTSSKIQKGNKAPGPEKPVLLGYRIENGDTILEVNMPAVVVYELRTFKNKGQQKKYDRLVNDVKIAYPIAKKSGEVWNLHLSLSKYMNDKDRKTYMKMVEDSLTKTYSRKIMGMNKRQGIILLKLIDRETQMPTYTMLKDLKGGFKTFFYQTTARMFGYNLKETFDPEEDDTDKYIEEIIKMIDAGRI